MNVLILGINRNYVNPYTEIVLKIFDYTCNCYFFGPGYVTRNELENGIDNYVERIENIDLLVTDSMIFEYSLYSNQKYAYRNAGISCSLDDVYRYGQSLENYFRKSALKKILIANWDYYATPKEHITYLKENNDCYVISYVDFKSFYSIRDAKRNGNSFISNIDSEYPDKNDNWYNFITENKNRVISLPNSFYCFNYKFFSSLDKRIRLDIPGFPYLERRITRELYNPKERRRHQYYELIFFGEKFVRRLSPKRSVFWGDLQSLRLFKRLYQNTITWTSGAVTRTPIAKYFEIPAAGSVLVCQSFGGMKELGFNHGTNCIQTESKEELARVLANTTPEDLKIISRLGQQMVLKNHSILARSRQLEKVLEGLKENSFKGSYWSRGKYIVL